MCVLRVQKSSVAIRDEVDTSSNSTADRTVQASPCAHFHAGMFFFEKTDRTPGRPVVESGTVQRRIKFSLIGSSSGQQSRELVATAMKVGIDLKVPLLITEKLDTYIPLEQRFQQNRPHLLRLN